MSKEQKFYPIGELNGLPNEHVAVDMKLPDYFPAEDVLVSPRRIARIARCGGFGKVILSTYDGEVSKQNAGIDGFDNDGTATMSTAATKQKAPLSREEFDGGTRNDKLYAFRWPTLRLDINVAEVEDKISRKSGGVRNPDNLSPYFDQAIKSGVKSAAKKHLINEAGPKGKFDLAWCSTVMPAAYSLVFGEPATLSNVAENVAIFNVISGNFSNTMNGKLLGNNKDRQRVSLVAGLHFDRLGMVYGLAKVQKMAKSSKRGRA